jgi:hypothetical protein
MGEPDKTEVPLAEQGEAPIPELFVKMTADS